MANPRDLVNSPLLLEDIDMSFEGVDLSEAEYQSVLDHDDDKQIDDEFYKFIDIIKDGDISEETKNAALKKFNADHEGKYKAEYGIVTLDGRAIKFSARLLCAKTNQEFSYRAGKIISSSSKKINNTTLEKKVTNDSVQPSKEGFFSTKNRCKAALYTSTAIGLAAVTLGYMTARMK